MQHALKRIWHVAREHLTHWIVAGAILAATGAAPEHWLADLFHDVHLPTDGLHLWAAGIDLRLALAGLGLALIAGDIAWRRARPAAAPVSIPTAAVPEAITHAPPLPDKPSIAVLPFDNMSGDPEQEYFSDGIAEDITTELSRNRWLFVIARNSSFTYKGRAVDLKQVGRELGVRYVLEGSVRRAGNRLRITAQLIEAEIGTHVWADRYDRTMDDMFAVQDEITEAVVAAIEPAMANVERQRAGSKAPGSLGTWELYQRGLWHFYKFTAEENLRAFEFLEQARSLDPDNASIHAALALVCVNRGWQFIPRSDETWIGLGLEHGRVAVALDPLDANARVPYSNALILRGQHEAALRESTQAVALNPNNTMAQGVHGAILAYSQRPAEAIPHLDLALRLNPLDPYRFVWVHVSCTAFYFMGDYESCLRSGQDLCRLQPNLVHGYRAVLVSLAELGRTVEARQYADVIFTKFNREMTAFLAVRYPEFRADDYDAYRASLAKGGLVLRDGVLTRVSEPG